MMAKVMESSSTTTTTTRTVRKSVTNSASKPVASAADSEVSARRRSRRSPSPKRASRSTARSPGRSPSRRRALNRSPSPHRYNTRHAQQASEELATEVKSGCCMTACVRESCSKVKTCALKLKSVSCDAVRVLSYVVLTYVAATMCTYGKCGFNLPEVPSLSVLYNEKALLSFIARTALAVVAFSIPFGQKVKGVPTDRGTLDYMCNSPAAAVFVVSAFIGAEKLEVKYVFDVAGTEMQLLFSCLIVLALVAVCLQWRFASFGAIYNLVLGIILLHYVDKRFRLTGAPCFCYSTSLLVLGMALTTYSLVRTMCCSVSGCAVKAASRGILILAGTWYTSSSHYELPAKACFLNTAALAVVLSIVTTQLWFIYKHRQCAKASSLVILCAGIATAALIHQDYLNIPAKFPYLSAWYVLNIGCVLDGLFVLYRSGDTNFLGSFKPIEFVKGVLAGEHDPRFGSLDLKFLCMRFGLLGSVLLCIGIGIPKFNAGTLTCPLSTVLGMTLLYSGTKLFCLEKAITSSSDVIEGKCGLGFMIWNVLVEPTLTTLPLKYAASMPGTEHSGCCYALAGLALMYATGLVMYTLATLQGHYLLIDEEHFVTKSLTTLQANGDERIPVSSFWRYIRYPFITGETMVVAAIALSCGVAGYLVYLPLLIHLITSLRLVRTYNKIAPSFYGVRVWKDYTQMVKFNIIPGVY